MKIENQKKRLESQMRNSTSPLMKKMKLQLLKRELQKWLEK